MSQVALAVAGAYVGWKILDNQLQLSNDVFLLKRMLPIKKAVEAGLKKGYNVADWWEDSVDKYKNKESVVQENKSYTFIQLDQLANKIAHWGISIGLKKGDVASIFMDNCPEYIALYLGFAKIGVISALINNNLRLKGLTHCINISESKVIVYGDNLADHIAEISSDIPNCQYYYLGGNASFGNSLEKAIGSLPSTRPSKENRKGVKLGDKFAYIYTSGTTGLPKAAVIPHQRMYLFGLSMYHGYLLKPDDRIYCVLPLYHSAACLGVGCMIEGGVTIIVKKKFSASTFWKDATEQRATVTQYIGELCRYLVNNPPGPNDRTHKIRIAIGNGLRPEIWGQFQERFNIPIIGEFYGATEGNATLVNLCLDKESRGAVGRQGYIAQKITGFKLAKFDVETDELVRGKDGFCIECKPGEVGELIGPILAHNPLTQFYGYTDKKATEKKILKDSFAKGDLYFRTGDLLMRDKRGFYYFMDRIGDTFRWKGENVSTNEVSEVVSVVPGVLEANIYGVQIPGKDGRACMAALVTKGEVNLDNLLAHCKKQLPSYSVPLFIRLLPQMEITGTFKHQKVTLRQQGIDLKVVTDPVYFLNPSTNKYELFTEEALSVITSGKSKL